MASVQYHGPETYTRYGTTYYIWHKGYTVNPPNVVMGGTGTLTVSRNGSTISGYITNANVFMVNSAHYNLDITINILANGIIRGTYTQLVNLSGAGDSESFNSGNQICNFSFDDDSELTFVVEYVCGESGGCREINYKPMTGSISIEAYNPWKDPTNLKNFTATPDDRIKPEGSVTLSWTAAQSGIGNTIDKYQIGMSISGGWIYKEVGNVTSVVIKPRDLLQSDKDIKPGMIITFAVRAHYTSQTAGYNDGWLNWVYLVDSQGNTKNIRIYKDGIIYYQYSSQGKKDCVAAYFQHPSQGKKPLRYILVKDSSGTKRIIDEYTTHY